MHAMDVHDITRMQIAVAIAGSNRHKIRTGQTKSALISVSHYARVGH
jgi:hypothetical protein